MPRSLAPRTCDRWGPLFSIDHSRSRAGCRNWRIDGETRGACSLKEVARVTSLVSPYAPASASIMYPPYGLPHGGVILHRGLLGALLLRCSLKARPLLH